jgi:hypothetical protein
VIACLGAGPVGAFTAYDCTNRSNVVEAYSLLEPDACASSGRDAPVYPSPSNRHPFWVFPGPNVLLIRTHPNPLPSERNRNIMPTAEASGGCNTWMLYHVKSQIKWWPHYTSRTASVLPKEPVYRHYTLPVSSRIWWSLSLSKVTVKCHTTVVCFLISKS